MNKKFTLLFILNLSFLFFSARFAKAQNVNIPDANFKAYLVGNTYINTNGDANIQVSEASAYNWVIHIMGLNISNLTGIAAFPNITSLVCYDNQLTSLNISANTALTTLWCWNNQLTSLNVSANTALHDLRCNNNQLTSLNVSANTLLNELHCHDNQLTSLNVSSSTSLQNLYCSNNQLTSLNVSANPALKFLYCDNNQLTSLNASASMALKFLYCNSNQLTSLYVPANSTLERLFCYSNQLTSLNVSAYTALNQLDCYSNQLTSLNVSANLALAYLQCSSNQLTSLNVSDNIALYQLHCDSNQLTSLNVSFNTGLGWLYCNSNQLTSLNVSSNNTLLSQLDCSYNLLTSQPQVPNQMQMFRINNNNISCLDNLPQMMNGSNTNDFNISNNPCTCVPNQTSYSGNLPLCYDNDPIQNPNNCQSVVNISGIVYKDLNSNCTYNSTDWQTQNIPVKVYDMQNNFKELSYTINGVYSFTALQPDSFQIKIDDANLPISIACGQSNTKIVDLDSTSQSITNNNFAVVCDTIDNKVNSVTGNGWVFPGRMHRLQINVANDATWYNLNCGSTNNYSGTVSIHLTGPVSYDTIANNALTPIISGNTFTYNISNFNNITQHSFGLKLLTDTTAQVHDQICVHVTIVTTPTDADTTNNEYDFCYLVRNSYDPNMKEVYPTNVLPGYNDWFTYTIHFQNTGTAPAFNIRLRDTLDTQLDRNTFEFLGASHTANTSLNGNILTVRFNNILLPDSTSDYEGSMGYYQYRVKPLPNITNGSTIENTAYIYFDYNPAIVTNTTQNNFDITVGNRVIEKNEVISIYPNPSTGIFTIKSASAIKTIEVFNLIGETVLQQTNGNTININNQPQGIYFCKVNGSSVVKLVKE